MLLFSGFVFASGFSDIKFDEQTLKAIKVMEGRLFCNEVEYESDSYRVERLERELLKKTYENDDLQTRIKRLQVASQKRTLSGTAVPAGWGKRFSANRINNDLIPDNDDDVGIIDGLLRVYNPDMYKKIRKIQGFGRLYDDMR